MSLQKYQQQPTGRLLLWAFRRFEQQLMKGLHQCGFTDALPSHLNVLRHLNPEGMRLVELARDASISKQALGKMVGDLAGLGYVVVVNDPVDRRAKIINYTDKGNSLIQSAIAEVSKIETQYIALLGEERYEVLRTLLTELIEQIEE